jgi:hypothetical protein
MQQHHTIQYVIVRDHIEDLRREARQARLAAKVRRGIVRTPRTDR